MKMMKAGDVMAMIQANDDDDDGTDEIMSVLYMKYLPKYLAS